MATSDISSALPANTEELSLSPSLLQVSTPAVASIPNFVAPALDASTLASTTPTELPTVKALSHPPLVFGSPFKGFIGRSFLQIGLWADSVGMYRRTRRATRESSIPVGDRLRQRLHLTCRTHPWVGAVSCAAAAGSLTILFYASSFKNLLPFAFLSVILLIATVFGREAGVLGTLTSALLFASVLFEPRPSVAIQDPVAQSHVIWMIVIGVLVSDFVGREKSASPSAVSVQKTRDRFR